MTATPKDHAARSADAGDGLQGFMGNDDWEELLAFVSDRIEAFEQLDDVQTRERVFELLQGIDAIHREALTRLVRLFKDGVLEQVITDPPIHTLMELYDLLPAEAGESADATSSAQGGQERHGATIPIRVDSEPPTGSENTAPPPHWVPVAQSMNAIAPGRVRLVPADDRELLLCRVSDRVYALDSRCPRDGTPLAQAGLDRYTLACPGHQGCYYDVRSGARVGGGEALAGYPVRHDDDGRILVGIGMSFHPELPAF